MVDGDSECAEAEKYKKDYSKGERGHSSKKEKCHSSANYQQNPTSLGMLVVI